MAAKPELQGLHEIHLPDPVSWLPQTVGWYAGLGILLLALAWWGYARWQRFAANRYRRLALAELADLARELQTSGQRAQVLRRLPVLLKRTALSAFPRAEVAPLTGAKWLAFLDRTIGGTEFTEGAGRLLGELAYAPTSHVEQFPRECVVGLLRVVRRWIMGHGRVPDGSGRGAEIPGRRAAG
jgi:hypothetical protein